MSNATLTSAPRSPLQQPDVGRSVSARSVIAALVLATVMSLVGSGVAFAGDDYPADCAPVAGENCRAAALDAYVDHWGFYSRECTSFVAWRLSRRGPFHNTMRGGRFGNAADWGANAQRLGFAVDDNPAVGAVAWTAGGMGHVAIVEAVHANGTVTVEEYNVPAYSGNYNRRTVARGAFRYIHIYDGGGTPAEGSFVRAPDGKVYRVAGGAPVYVSTWDAFGGGQPVVDVSFAQLDSMRPWPADGTFVNTTQDGRVYRIAGGAPIYVSTWDTYGGPQPTVGIDKWAVDNIGNPAAHMRAVPADGTFINTTQDGRVYRIAGGAPIYVSTWDTYGGPQPTVGIDKWAVDNIGNPAAHMRAVPADGTFINTTQDGAVYRIAGGAPIYVSTWDTYGGPQPTVGIDKWAVDNIGNPAAHMRAVPADGTFINTTQDGAVYRIAGGAPIYVSTWDTYGGPQPTVGIDKWAVDNIGNPAAHMRAVPADGTFINTTQDGAVYRIAGGAPLYISTWSIYGGAQPTVGIDKWAVDNVSRPGAHMRAVPADGTVLQGLPSGRFWNVQSGRRTSVTAGSGAVAVTDGAVDAIPLATCAENQTGTPPNCRATVVSVPVPEAATASGSNAAAANDPGAAAERPGAATPSAPGTATSEAAGAASSGERIVTRTIKIRRGGCAARNLRVSGSGVKLVTAKRLPRSRCRLTLRVSPGATGRRDLLVGAGSRTTRLKRVLTLA